VECHTRIPRSRRPVAVEDDQAGDKSSKSDSTLVTPGGIAVSKSEKAETIADTLDTTVSDGGRSFGPTVIEFFDVARRSYFQTPASEPKLTNPDEVHEAIWGLKFCKSPGLNGLSNIALKHLPQRAVSILVQIFNAILTHYLPSLWKRPRLTSILKPGNDPALLSSYRPIILLDTTAKRFE